MVISTDIQKEQFFERQITLQEIGEKGQQQLQETSVLLVGCGGLGSPIAVYLAASGIGTLHLVDFDTVSISNLHRQVFYTLADVGKPKAATLAKCIAERTPFTQVTFSNKALQKGNIRSLVSAYDIVVDATDALPIKYLLNDTCVLQGKPLVYGSLYKFDGYVAAFNVQQKDGSYSAHLRDAFPIMATDVPTCETAGTLNTIVGLVAMQQVNEVLKWATGIGKLLTNQLLIYNSLENTQLKMTVQNSISKDEVALIFKKELYGSIDCSLQNPHWLLSVTVLKDSLYKVSHTQEYVLISVLENKQIPFPFTIDRYLPLSQIESTNFSPVVNTTYVFVCRKGIRSYEAVAFLKEKHPTATLLSLAGGLEDYLAL